MRTTTKIAIGSLVKTRFGVMVVAGYHLLERKGKNRQLAEYFTGDAHGLDVDCLVGYPAEDKTGNTTLRISYSQAQPVDGPSVPVSQAVMEYRRRKYEVKSKRSTHASKNISESYDKGLLNLNDGDPIEVQVRGGSWVKAMYLGIVKDSGNVRFVFASTGKKTTCSPKFVRKVV